jgi:hypothetical protein
VGDSTERRLEVTQRAQRVAAASAYGLLAVTLVSTRLIGLDSSLWHDEVVAVVEFIRAGPGEILSGPDLSHELFGILAWATSSAVGESEIAFRLWSVLPFVLGVGVVTAWLHARLGALAGILFLFLATASPLLLDISRQARGYGLAFLAMGVLLVAALEATRTPRGWWPIVAFCVAGVVGTCTLPQFGIAFAATSAALITDARLRLRAALAVGISLLTITAWYAPHIGEVRGASRIEDGVQIGTLELLVAPFHHVLIPALLWIDGTVVVASIVWLPLVLLAAVMMASSPLLRDRRSAAILCSGVVATLLVLWLAQAYVIPRYLSFLLVPLFLLLASGMSAILRPAGTRPALLRTLACAALVGIVTFTFLSVVLDVVRFPREAYRDAARTVERETVSTTPVLAYLRNPDGLDFYLDRPVRSLDSTDVEERVCESDELVAFVVQPFGIPDVDASCLDRAGTRHFRARQYARGGEMNIWLVPPG